MTTENGIPFTGLSIGARASSSSLSFSLSSTRSLDEVSEHVQDWNNPQCRRKTTILLVFVPFVLFLTPQQLAVFVNSC